LIFEFGNNEKIIIKTPSHIVINDKVIGIQNIEKIEWIAGGLDLKYKFENGSIQTKLVIGEHYFRIKQNSAALLFYTW
jgi:hypothetical protein